MTMYRYKPSKPMGVLSAAIGVGMLIFGIVQLTQEHNGGSGFLVLWCVGLVAIIAFNLWLSFSSKGTVGVFMPKGGAGMKEIDDNQRADKS